MNTHFTRFLVLLLLIAGTCELTAQDDGFDRLMTMRRLSCYDIEDNCRILIPHYYAESKMDSLRLLLRYWERNCGLREAITRMELILDAGIGRLNRYPFTEQTIRNLLHFKRKSEFARNNPEQKEVIRENFFWFSAEPINDQFDLFTALTASRLRDSSGDRFSRTLMGFYSGETDSLFVRANDGTIANEIFRTAYDSVVTAARSEFTPYMGFTLGYWMPNGKAELLGNHPEAGFVFGGMKEGYALELMLAIRFLASAHHYVVQHNGAPAITDYYFGGYIAGHFGLDLWSGKTFDVSVLSGIAYDGFDAVESTNNNSGDGTSVNSLNVNLGVGSKIYTGELRGDFFNIEVRYNFVNYFNPGGTDLSGDAVTVRFGYSWSSSAKYELLRELGAY